jgi:hypothetical protein
VCIGSLVIVIILTIPSACDEMIFVACSTTCQSKASDTSPDFSDRPFTLKTFLSQLSYGRLIYCEGEDYCVLELKSINKIDLKAFVCCRLWSHNGLLRVIGR